MDITIVARSDHNGIHINLYLATTIINLSIYLKTFGALNEGIFHIY